MTSQSARSAKNGFETEGKGNICAAVRGMVNT